MSLIATPKLDDEAGRLAALDRADILDTGREPAFDRITSLVRLMLGAPISAITFVDADRSWFKSIQGLEGESSARDISFCQHTIQSADLTIVPDTALDARFRDNPFVTHTPPGVRAYAGAPLQTPDGYNVGTLCAVDTVERPFTEAQMAILRELAALAMEQVSLRRIAQSDHLTGCLSRRAFTAAMDAEIARHGRYGHPSALLLLDVDHFKRVNDTWGHKAGDEVLKAVVSCCETLIRPNDSLGRVGGEEFAIVLAETDTASAVAAADRYREAIAGLTVGDQGLRVTASFGIAPVETCATATAWLDLADQGLYAAKHQGRNRCVVANG